MWFLCGNYFKKYKLVNGFVNLRKKKNINECIVVEIKILI